MIAIIWLSLSAAASAQPIAATADGGAQRPIASGVGPALARETTTTGNAAVSIGAWPWKQETYLGYWYGSLQLPELARCWQRYGGDATIVANAMPAGHAERAIETRIYPRHRDFDRKLLIATVSGPYPEQVAALTLLQTRRAVIAERTLDAIHAYFVEREAAYVKDEIWTPDGPANFERMKRREATCETLVLRKIWIHNKARDGIANIGLIFDTMWDSGHGLGVLLHGDRVAETGHADTAVNPSMWADEEKPK